MEAETVVILDFGSQYTQLIARRVRELNVYSVIYPCDCDFATIQAERPIALILSGGPGSVYDADAPGLDEHLLELGVPILGICYGMQEVIRLRGGQVVSGRQGGEYGRTSVRHRTEIP